MKTMSRNNKKTTGLGVLVAALLALGGYWLKGGQHDKDTGKAEQKTVQQAMPDSGRDGHEESIGKSELYSQVSATAPLELPQGGASHGVLVEHTGYTLSYDTLNHNPFWVAWQLTRQESKGRVGRGDEFKEDPSIPARHAVRPSTYSGSGYSRGHMCPAGDQKWSREAMDDSFYMTNMCPQTFELNKLWWDWLERAERQWAAEEGSVYIVCGPIYEKNRQVKNLNKKKSFFVGIPHKFFKVILSTRQGSEKALGFIYRNDASEQLLEDAVCSVDEIERITGYDFFAPLDDAIENRIEANDDLQQWGSVAQPQWDE